MRRRGVVPSASGQGLQHTLLKTSIAQKSFSRKNEFARPRLPAVVFRPLDADGDAAARRPYLVIPRRRNSYWQAMRLLPVRAVLGTAICLCRENDGRPNAGYPKQCSKRDLS